MPVKKIRVLVVDDSALMRRYLRELLTETGEFEVSTARDGVDALAQLHAVNPDVITLDINMPEMDGLTCLARIMTERPKPVLMVSSLTTKGAEATYEALALGAVDFFAKPDGTISLSLRQSSEQIVALVRAAAGARVSNTRGLGARLRTESARIASAVPKAAGTASLSMGLVLIGVSTGGPRVLEEILPKLPADYPWPVLVAQHMPGSFTGSFSRRLDSVCKLGVEELTNRSTLLPGRAYIGRGDADLIVIKRGGQLMGAAVPSDTARLWHPSVSRLVETALSCLEAPRLVGVMLTGMGNDGAEPMTRLHRLGGRTVAEDESTAVVFGMPGELIKAGGASVVLPSNRIAQQLIAWMKPVLAASGRGAP
jgi:two-component system chemotaxis response regulator CheB